MQLFARYRSRIQATDTAFDYQGPPTDLASTTLEEAASKAVDNYRLGREFKERAGFFGDPRGAVLGNVMTREYRAVAVATFTALEACDPAKAQELLRVRGLKRGVFVAFKKDEKFQLC